LGEERAPTGGPQVAVTVARETVTGQLTLGIGPGDTAAGPAWRKWPETPFLNLISFFYFDFLSR
jgi:hypothetical protein